MSRQRIADLTTEELKSLIREAVTETIVEVFSDPDRGLEVRGNMKRAIQRSVAAAQAGGKTISAKEVAARLGLEW